MICDSKWSVNVYFPLTPTIYDLKYSLSKQNKNSPRRAEVEMFAEAVQSKNLFENCAFVGLSSPAIILQVFKSKMKV